MSLQILNNIKHKIEVAAGDKFIADEVRLNKQQLRAMLFATTRFGSGFILFSSKAHNKWHDNFIDYVWQSNN